MADRGYLRHPPLLGYQSEARFPITAHRFDNANKISEAVKECPSGAFGDEAWNQSGYADLEGLGLGLGLERPAKRNRAYSGATRPAHFL
jgi:hypothetical protein